MTGFMDSTFSLRVISSGTRIVWWIICSRMLQKQGHERTHAVHNNL